MCCVLDVVGQPHTTFDKTILSSSRFLESYFVNMLFIIFGRCVYLSQSVPLIFPVTQVAILTPVIHCASQRINKEESIVTPTGANPISLYL